MKAPPLQKEDTPVLASDRPWSGKCSFTYWPSPQEAAAWTCDACGAEFFKGQYDAMEDHDCG